MTALLPSLLDESVGGTFEIRGARLPSPALKNTSRAEDTSMTIVCFGRSTKRAAAGPYLNRDAKPLRRGQTPFESVFGVRVRADA